MKLLRTLAVLLVVSSPLAAQTPEEISRWQRRAQNVTIIRDDWGIPHVYGRTDADAVFGVMYAQAEDDFNRVENNYINSMGRAAEHEGESAIFRDLRMKLFINPDSMRAMYTRSPDWLKALMDAFADGLNFYLYKNPHVKPKVIARFEPWMALTFSEGSIGGDIERVSVPELRAFYANMPAPRTTPENGAFEEPRGSNGIAIAPQNTLNGRALLLINPHTSFYFRAEAQMVSEEGLNAYGAVTWGQFFIYQGFNDRAGWMHTSSSVDNIDEYVEDIITRDGKLFYRVGKEQRPVHVSRITIPYRTANGGLATREFTTYRTHHGPIVRAEDGKWIAMRLMEEPLKALQQSYLRTKARNLGEFRKTMELHTNSSNNTLFADAEGNIAYLHANFIPRRDTSFEWSNPVSGSDPRTEWQGVLSIDESPNVINPRNGWVYNTNNWPYSAAGPHSPKQANYAKYVDGGSENARGLHAIRVLENRKDFTISALIDAAYDEYLTAFEALLPPLLRDYDAAPATDPMKRRLPDQIAMLSAWDYRWSDHSIPTTLAIYWGDELQRSVAAAATRARVSSYDYAITGATPAERFRALVAASDTLTAHFGTWRTSWGHINRFQRLTSDIVQRFSDSAQSIPVAFPSARWGSLASFGARRYPNTKRWYGTSGNSFVAVVEFGRDSVRARAVTAGGQSGDPTSKHFQDQAVRYATGDLRAVYFYRSQLAGHIEREYHPGQ
jgi:acyl-homoserine-lactone acylase